MGIKWEEEVKPLPESVQMQQQQQQQQQQQSQAGKGCKPRLKFPIRWEEKHESFKDWLKRKDNTKGTSEERKR